MLKYADTSSALNATFTKEVGQRSKGMGSMLGRMRLFCLDTKPTARCGGLDCSA
jgi:hypothetical protein